jgi:hypothetical protein
VETEQLVRSAVYSGTRAVRERRGVGLVAVVSQYIATRCRSQYVSLRSLQAPRTIKNPNSVTSERPFEPTRSVVWLGPSVSETDPRQQCSGAKADNARLALAAQ